MVAALKEQFVEDDDEVTTQPLDESETLIDPDKEKDTFTSVTLSDKQEFIACEEKHNTEFGLYN